jgi:hypothetical protein
VLVGDVFVLVNEDANRRFVILERFVLVTVELHGVAEKRVGRVALMKFGALCSGRGSDL